MPVTYDLLLKGATVVNHDGSAPRDIAVSDGRIAAIGVIPPSASGETIDCRGLHIIPGVIDTQVHFREPGLEHKEDLATGSRAAVAGGVTAVFEMPNTNPPTTTADGLADKLARARHRMFCDFAFFIGGTRANAHELPELERLPGCAGVKVFMGSSTGSLLVHDDEGVADILRRIARRAAFHAEDEFRLAERRGRQVHDHPASHPDWRDEEAARLSVERLLRLARAAGKRVHVLHVTSASEFDLLARHRDVASVEVTPHHLTLVAPDDYHRLGTLAQMNPPVRDAAHQAALWRAVRSGLVDVLGSDHAPHSRDEKAKPYPQSPSGAPGVQTLVPLMLDHVAAGRLTLERLVDLTSHGPARLFGITRKGRIAEGYDADLTVVDLRARRTITNDWIESRCGWTPYDGLSVQGWPVGTLVRGRRAMWEGTLADSAGGEAIAFLECLPRRNAEDK
ncbi:MAG: dihydroorotase [Aestuariivirgaceae bacterium]